MGPEVSAGPTGAQGGTLIPVCSGLPSKPGLLFAAAKDHHRSDGSCCTNTSSLTCTRRPLTFTAALSGAFADPLPPHTHCTPREAQKETRPVQGHGVSQPLPGWARTRGPPLPLDARCLRHLSCCMECHRQETSDTLPQFRRLEGLGQGAAQSRCGGDLSPAGCPHSVEGAGASGALLRRSSDPVQGDRLSLGRRLRCGLRLGVRISARACEGHTSLHTTAHSQWEVSRVPGGA